MISIDTNVLARAIAEEVDADAATRRQQQQARALLASGQPLFVPISVVLELEWVLRGAYGVTSTDIADLLEDLLAIENLTVDRASAVSQALQAYRGGLDLADALHLAQSGLCTSLATFDVRFVKGARKLGLKPPVRAPAA